MTKEELKNPAYWFQRFLEDPLQATIELSLVLIANGYFDVSSLWRQFYDDRVGVDVFRWNSLLVYTAGCAFMYAAIRRGVEGRLFRGFKDYLLPDSVRRARSFRIDLQFYLLQLSKAPALLLYIVSAVFFIHLIPRTLGSLHLYERQPLLGMTSLLAGLPLGWKVFVAYWVAFLAREFGYYWTHRLFHSSNVLWQFHKIHHYARQLNLLAITRFHPIDTILATTAGNFTASLALACLCRFDLSTLTPEQTLAQWVTGYWWPLPVTALIFAITRFSHSHVPFSFGPVLDRVVVSPAVHIVHHSRDVPGKNFGSILSVWDTVFGTFHRHDFRQPINLGINDVDDGRYAHCGQALLEPITSAWRLMKGGVR